MQYEVERYKEQLEEIDTSSLKPLDSIIAINKITTNQLLQWSPAFYRDIGIYPEAKQLFFDSYIAFVQVKQSELFLKCIENKIFIPEIDMNMIFDFFKKYIKVLTEKCHSGEILNMELEQSIMSTFLSGICTEAGREGIRLYNRNRPSEVNNV